MLPSKSGCHLLFILPTSSFGRDEVEFDGLICMLSHDASYHHRVSLNDTSACYHHRASRTVPAISHTGSANTHVLIEGEPCVRARRSRACENAPLAVQAVPTRTLRLARRPCAKQHSRDLPTPDWTSSLHDESFGPCPIRCGQV